MFNRIDKINALRNSLVNHKVTIGSWMQINSPDVAEIMGRADYDWVAIDMEHGSISNTDLPNLIRSLQLGDTLPLVRIQEGSRSNCKQALDSGACGVIVPMIMDSKELQNVIDWCCWPPKGNRGVGFSRANLFGKYFEEYKDESQSPLIIAQIEHIKAVNNLEEILKVRGLDATIIGPYDISASLGITGELDHPDVLSVCEKVIKLSKKYDIPTGIHVIEPKEKKLSDALEKGYKFIAYSIDALFLQNILKNPLK